MVLGTCLGSLFALVLYLQTVTKPGRTRTQRGVDPPLPHGTDGRPGPGWGVPVRPGPGWRVSVSRAELTPARRHLISDVQPNLFPFSLH